MQYRCARIAAPSKLSRPMRQLSPRKCQNTKVKMDLEELQKFKSFPKATHLGGTILHYCRQRHVQSRRLLGSVHTTSSTALKADSTPALRAAHAGAHLNTKVKGVRHKGFVACGCRPLLAQHRFLLC